MPQYENFCVHATETPLQAVAADRDGSFYDVLLSEACVGLPMSFREKFFLRGIFWAREENLDFIQNSKKPLECFKKNN